MPEAGAIFTISDALATPRELASNKSLPKFIEGSTAIWKRNYRPSLNQMPVTCHSVIDGDTLEMRGERIRLWGIDALESDQLCRGDDSKRYQCGRLAANTLATLLVTISLPVTCSRTGHVYPARKRDMVPA
jgi:endonuclease YncB( thermonuclease family)